MTASEARTSWPMWSDTPWAELSSSCGELVRGVLRPGDCLVVGGAGFEAAVEDADEPVAELAERSVVAGAAGALAGGIGARSWWFGEGGQGLGAQGVGEAAVADIPGQDGLASPGRASDRAGPGVVLPALGGSVTAGGIAELAEYPGAGDRADPGLGQVDLSVRVRPKMGMHLDLQFLDLLVQRDDHPGSGLHGGRVGRGHRRRLLHLRIGLHGEAAQEAPHRPGILGPGQ